MNNTQRNYAKKRIEELRKRKELEAREVCTIKSKTISQKERLSLLQKNKVPVRKSLGDATRYDNSVTVYFDFSEFETVRSFDGKKYTTLCEKINKTADHIIDNIMLGDTDFSLIKHIQQLEEIEIK